jgi:hypothetical protein
MLCDLFAVHAVKRGQPWSTMVKRADSPNTCFFALLLLPWAPPNRLSPVWESLACFCLRCCKHRLPSASALPLLFCALHTAAPAPRLLLQQSQSLPCSVTTPTTTQAQLLTSVQLAPVTTPV